MTKPQNALPLLADVERTQRRTRRRLEVNWFTCAVIGAALVASGAAQLTLGDQAGWLALVGSLAVAYGAIAIRWWRTEQRFPGATPPPDADLPRLPWAPFAVSALIAVGDVVLSNVLEDRSATLAVAGWTAIGCFVFAGWLRSGLCLALGISSLAVGALAVAAGADDRSEAALYGAAFLIVAAGGWIVAGRRRVR